MNGKNLFLGLNYVNAKYIDEAEASVAYVRNSRVWQINLGKA